MLTNALEVRALRETLRNQAIQQAVHDIDNWRLQQTESLISDLVNSVTSQSPDLSTLAHEVGLDPRVQKWVDDIRPHLRLAAIRMINQETVEDIFIPHAQELLETDWLRRQTEIRAELQAKSTALMTELTADMEVAIEARKAALQQAAEDHLRNFERELDSSTADEIQRIKNKSKSIIQQTNDDEESRTLHTVVWTPKAVKPSPLNISKPKKKKTKKIAVLDLTTPSPANKPSEVHTDMETDADSTPTTPICRSTIPSPAPIPHEAPETVATTVADPDSIPRWARTPSPDEKTPHAPSFPTNPPPNDMSVILAAITGLRTELLGQIEKVNARVDLATGPQTIADHVVWNNENMAAWEHPGYVDPIHDADMENLVEANAAREAERLAAQCSFRALHHRFVAEKKINPLDNENDLYLEKWYDVCSDLVKSMNWDALHIPPEANNTILNAWRRAERSLNEEEYVFTTHATFERITGTKADLSSPEGRTRFNTFTTAFNEFCATQNFPASEGFPESQDSFFTYFLANSPKSAATTTSALQPATSTTTPKSKSVRFTSAPPIATSPPAPSSSPEEFPALQAPSKAPISYASATSAFIPVTRRCRGKQPVSTTQPAPTLTTISTPTTKPGSKPTKPTKPPLPDALKTTKHTIILDHTLPDTKALYSLNAGELTLGLQRHLEAIKAPLVLLAGSWSTAPFYKNFILTVSVLTRTALSGPCWLHGPSRSGVPYVLQIILRTNKDIMDCPLQ